MHGISDYIFLIRMHMMKKFFDLFLLPELCVVTVRTVKRPTEILAGT